MAETLHATSVSWHGKAVVITGASGSGKSTLGLQLMALGCDLVADDRTQLDVLDAQLVATCPAALSGMIEARHVGILSARPVPSATVTLVVDMDQTEVNRLPPARKITIMKCVIPLIWRSKGPHFAPAILQILKSGWSTT
ncbi:MAG: HPr kinase/phosphorylase [Yoonia sp.]|uniref:HPr kinase/phosphorylase n=1 Tax=Yoonia sp. TaxID=2212373 RepID=UPI003EF16F65